MNITKPDSFDLFLSVFEKSQGSIVFQAEQSRFNIIAVSDIFLHITGLNRTALVGKNYTDVFGLQNGDDLLSELKYVETQGQKTDLIYHTSKFSADENLSVWSVNLVPVPGQNKDTAFILATINPLAETVANKVDYSKVKEPGAQHDLIDDLFMKAPVGVALFNKKNLVIDYANEAICEMWDNGGPLDVKGKPLFDIVAEAAADYERLLYNVMETGNEFIGYEEPVLLRRDDKVGTYYFNLMFKAMRDDKNIITGIIALAVEITTQVRSRLELVESERKFRNLVEQSPISMGIFKGPDLLIELFNEPLLEVWGKKAEEVRDRRLLDVFPELEGQPFPQLLKQVYLTGQPYSSKENVAFVKTASGFNKVYVNLKYVPLFEADGSVSGVMISSNNITEYIEARNRLEYAEERLRLAVEATGLGTFDLNLRSGEIIHSPRLAGIFGLDGGTQVPHTLLRQSIHPDDVHSIVERAFAKAINTGNYFYEARIIWPDGSIHWIRTQGKVIFDEAGTALRMLGTVVDITAQQTMIGVLKESEENLRLATSAADIGTFDMDLIKGTMEWDKRCRELFGIFTKADVTYNHDFLNGLHPDDRERVGKIVENVFNKELTGGDYDTEYRTVGREDNKIRWVRAKGKAFFNDDDIPYRFLGSVIDITENKQDEIRKNDFIAMASHELKTPLTSLKAYLQLLTVKVRKTDDEFLNNALSKANTQVNKMNKLIADFLDTSRMEAGKLNLNISSFHIDELIDSVVEDVRPLANKNTIIYRSQTGINLVADKDKIDQVLSNLISNAVKYTPDGGDIVIEAVHQNNEIKISITDQGIGISPAEQKSIFKRFYRAEKYANSNAFSGFGIGLYLSSEIIQRHNGTIGVLSEEGKGSTFYFTLPVGN